MELQSQVDSLTGAQMPSNRFEDQCEFKAFKLVIQDFNAAQDSIVSYPVMVDGRSFNFRVYPKGVNEGKDTHLSIAIEISSIEKYLALDLPDEIEFKIMLPHPTHGSKVYSQEFSHNIVMDAIVW